MTVQEFVASLYQDREKQYLFLNLVSREVYQGASLDLALRFKMGWDYINLPVSMKQELKQALRDMYNSCVMT